MNRTVVGVASLGAVVFLGVTSSGASASDVEARNTTAATVGLPLPPNSVGTRQLAPLAVGHSDLGKGVIGLDNIWPGTVNYLRTPLPNSVTSTTTKDGSLSENDLNSALKGKINDTTGQVRDVEADGAYPGRVDPENNLQTFPHSEHSSGGPLKEGAQSTELWQPGPKKQQSWVMCPTGKTLLSGGFGVNDGDDRKIQIVSSAPAQVRMVTRQTGELYYEPIKGDDAGSFVPNAWLVEGYNNGTEPTMVRPHMVCASIG